MQGRQWGILAAALAVAVTARAETVFPPAEILAWDQRTYVGESDFTLVEHDGETVLRVRCDGGAASGYFLEREIDLAETPVLEWSWRLDDGFSDIDETEEEGDDYALRVFVVDRHTVLRWRTRALNYVWASEQPQGSDWPNPYQHVAHNVALRSGVPEDGGVWHTERRNLRDDFREYHDRDVGSVDAIAVIASCDDTGQSAEGRYGTFRLLPE